VAWFHLIFASVGILSNTTKTIMAFTYSTHTHDRMLRVTSFCAVCLTTKTPFAL